jgi:GrpB-like predicted nucleotidyltransferase (UPF0157 family)
VRFAREPLLLVPYDPRWSADFDVERDRLQAAMGSLAVRIDHHGSTSVPGLAAKPIIDIQISVRSLVPLSAYAAPLEQLGYTHKPHPDDAWCPYFFKPASKPHTHHVHVVEAGGKPERRTLAFRDFLREHGDAARAYEQLKRELAAAYERGDLRTIDEYANAKTAFVEATFSAALAAGYPR